MKRYTYGQNFTTMNTGKFFLLNFMGLVDVAPGDTISGTTAVHTWTDTTDRPVMNRTYTDTYAFYVPYRLLWDQWVDFITDSDSGLTPPSYAQGSTLLELMEGQARVDGSCNAWNRRAYNLIWNRYFRTADQVEVGLDDPFLKTTSLRESTFHEASLTNGTIPLTDVAIDVVGESISLEALREGFAKDRFDKIRAYYGSKYTDYLASLSVKTSWSIAEEPEVIGKATRDFNYRTISATADEDVGQTNIGDPAGYFETKHSMRLRNTFAPEHGVVVFVGCCRMDITNQDGVAPHLAKNLHEQYYSPEYETRRLQGWPGNIYSTNAGNGETRYFEDYRKPCNQFGFSSTADSTQLYWATYIDANAQAGDYKRPPLTATAALFTGNMGGSQSVEYCQYMAHRLRKKSPVRPPAQITGVS